MAVQEDWIEYGLEVCKSSYCMHCMEVSYVVHFFRNKPSLEKLLNNGANVGIIWNEKKK